MTQFKVTFLAGLLACSIALTGCNGSSGGFQSQEKVATVDGIVVTKSEYDKIYKQYQQMLQMGNTSSSKPDPMVEDTLKRLTLNRLFLNTFIQHDAEKLGITVSADEINEVKDKQLAQVGGKDALENLLKQHNMTEADFEDSIRQQILVNKFLDKQGGDKLKISDAEIEKYYQSHPTEFDLPEMIHASHILVKAIVPEIKKELRDKNPKMTDSELEKALAQEKTVRKQKAEKLYSQVKLIPTQFNVLAQKESDDKVSGARGGDLDNLQESQVDPIFWHAVERTKPGTLYPGVLETQFGYHIIRVIDHISPHRQSIKEARNVIATKLSELRKKEVFEQWAAEKKKAKIVIEPAYKPSEKSAGSPTPPPAEKH